MTSDPIRAHLGLIGGAAPKYVLDALLAVLDLCNDDIRRVIAEHLGVTDALDAGTAIDWEPVSETTRNMMRAIQGDFDGETPSRPRVGAMLFCAACRVAYDSRRQDHSGH